MNCEEFDQVVELYAVGELGPEATARAQGHLADCPVCTERLAAAQRRLATLEAALRTHQASDQLVQRTMVRVHFLAREVAEGPEPLRSRLLRYAMTAAAAMFFILAGYGFLRRGPLAVVEKGSVALIGPRTRTVAVNSRLAPGDLVATPSNSTAVLSLAGGRLKATLGPGTIVRVADPRSGAALHVLRGEVYCRSETDRGVPVVAAPLARVAPGRGVISLHVHPQPGPARGFRGSVTLIAHEGRAAVVMGGRRGVVRVGRGQVVTVRSDGGRGLLGPAPLERLRQEIERRLAAVVARRDELKRSRRHLAERLRLAPVEAQGELFRQVAEVEETLRRFDAINAQLLRQRTLLERCQGRILLAPATERP